MNHSSETLPPVDHPHAGSVTEAGRNPGVSGRIRTTTAFRHWVLSVEAAERAGLVRGVGEIVKVQVRDVQVGRDDGVPPGQRPERTIGLVRRSTASSGCSSSVMVVVSARQDLYHDSDGSLRHLSADERTDLQLLLGNHERAMAHLQVRQNVESGRSIEGRGWHEVMVPLAATIALTRTRVRRYCGWARRYATRRFGRWTPATARRTYV